MDFGFCLSPSSHVKMDSVDLTTFNRLREYKFSKPLTL